MKKYIIGFIICAVLQSEIVTLLALVILGYRFLFWLAKETNGKL